MGLLTEAWVNRRWTAGDTATNLPDSLDVRVKVQGPRWIKADRIELYANGRKLFEKPIAHKESVVKLDSEFRIPRPAHDAWLVAVATGPGISEPYWPIPRPYQPASPHWEPRVVGATNPVWLDCDGDARFTSPAGYAKILVDAGGGDIARIVASLAAYDESVAVQAAAELRKRGLNLSSQTARNAIDRAAPAVRHAFVAYQNALPSP
jgi:hypothetical protein